MFRHLLLIACLLLAVPVTRAQDQTLPDAAFEATIARAQSLIPTLGRPDRWGFQVLLPSTDSAVMCPLVPGYKTDTTRTPFIVTLFYGETEYVLHTAQDGSIIQPCDEKFGAAGSGMSLAQPVPQAADACTVSPSGPFANVRVQPNTEADSLGEIQAQRLVLGRDENTTWYLTENGWVAGTVVTTSGDCDPATLPPRSTTLANGLLAPPTPAPDVQVTAIPGAAAPTLTVSDFPCLPDFAGYLEPRIIAGPVTAQVELGGLPNSIRALPTTESERLGQIQPGRRLDLVLGGPQCSDGFVWWEVEIDGVVGWTAESSAQDNSYYLMPLVQRPNSNGEGVQVPGAAALTLTTVGGVQRAAQLNAMPAQAFAWADDDTLTVAADRVQRFDVSDPANPVALATAVINSPSAIAIAPDETLTVGLTAGQIVLDAAGPQPTTVTAHAALINVMAYNPDGTVLATGSGTDDSDNRTWVLRLWDVVTLQTGNTDAALLRVIRFPYPVLDAAFSEDGGYLAVVAGTQGDNPAAALWLYTDGGLGDNTYSEALNDAGGFPFVATVPLDSSGEFVYGNGPTLRRLDAGDGETEGIVTQDGLIVTEAAFSPARDGNPFIVVTHTSAPDGPSGGIPVLAYDYTALNAGDDVVPVLVGMEVADAIAFNPAGDALAVHGLNESVAVYSTP